MSRKLTGSKKHTDAGWTASLPIHRGAAKRRTYAFTTEEAADRWIAAPIAAIENGTDLPVPDADDRVAPKRTQKAGTDFRRDVPPRSPRVVPQSATAGDRLAHDRLP